MQRTDRVAAGPDQVFDMASFESPPKRGRTDAGRRRWPIVVILALVLALIAGGLVAALSKGVFTPSHPVPSITGMTLAQARNAVAKDHFTVVDQGSASSITVKAGRIVSQDPASGSSLKQGSKVTVTVSKGLPIEQVPSLLGLNCTGATRLLAVNHLKGACPDAAAGYSNSIPVGQVFNWSYNDKLNATHAPYGATVLIALSKGPAPINIPDVAGQTYQQAQSALQAAGLSATESSAPSATTAAGYVDHTNPAIGTPVPPGTTVTVFISTGPPTVQVPNESGKSVAVATADLQSKGLSVGSVFGPAKGKVFASVPEPGTTVQEGSSINLYTA